MQKIQLFLREDQKAALKSISARTGKKRSALIRSGIDLLIERANRENTDWREATRAAAGIWRDRTDIDEVGETFRAAVRRRFSSAHDRG